MSIKGPSSDTKVSDCGRYYFLTNLKCDNGFSLLFLSLNRIQVGTTRHCDVGGGFNSVGLNLIVPVPDRLHAYTSTSPSKNINNFHTITIKLVY